jgi:hypothetical protein
MDDGDDDDGDDDDGDGDFNLTMKGNLSVLPSDATNTMIDSSNDVSRFQFLTVHLNILKALYLDESRVGHDDHKHIDTSQQDQHPQSTTGSTSGVRQNVQPLLDTSNVWDHIQSFMMYQRESLLQIQQRIEHISNIRQAALKYCHATSSSTVTDSVISTNQSHNDRKGTVAHQNLQPSIPVVPIPSSSSLHKSRNDSFRIIANIIGYQSKVVQQQKQVPSLVVLQQLLQEVTKRIASLQKAIDTKPGQLLPLKNNNHGVQWNVEDFTTTIPKSSPTIGDDRSHRTELQYKIHLWSLLAHDLKQVLKD